MSRCWSWSLSEHSAFSCLTRAQGFLVHTSFCTASAFSNILSEVFLKYRSINRTLADNVPCSFGSHHKAEYILTQLQSANISGDMSDSSGHASCHRETMGIEHGMEESLEWPALREIFSCSPSQRQCVAVSSESDCLLANADIRDHTDHVVPTLDLRCLDLASLQLFDKWFAPLRPIGPHLAESIRQPAWRGMTMPGCPITPSNI